MSANRAMNPMEQGRQVAYVLKEASFQTFFPGRAGRRQRPCSASHWHRRGGLAWWKFSDSPRPHRQLPKSSRLRKFLATVRRPTSKPAWLALPVWRLRTFWSAPYRGQRHETFMHGIHLRETIATLLAGGHRTAPEQGLGRRPALSGARLAPCGDIDLYVDPDRLEEAVRVRASNPGTRACGSIFTRGCRSCRSGPSRTSGSVRGRSLAMIA